VDDKPAPLFLVSPSRINMLVPSTAPTSGTAEFQVVRKSTGQILASAPVDMNVASPGLFTVNETGSGQVLAFNEDGKQNTATDAAERGTVITILGTGQGPVAGGPPDGEAAQGEVPTTDNPRVFVGTCYIDEAACMDGNTSQLLYSGLRAGEVGVWEIRFRIPKATAPDKSVPVYLQYKSMFSAAPASRIITTIAVK